MKTLVEIFLATFVGFSVLAITSGAKQCYKNSGNCKTEEDCGFLLTFRGNPECGSGQVCCLRPCKQGFGVCTKSDDCKGGVINYGPGSNCYGDNEVCCWTEPEYPYKMKLPNMPKMKLIH
ncbi:CLUMA_CG007703, isoform A [Clunio marinus]|uniref:CLUMA_CG007703, isoform A n=1 Tax=Clunio marinus TaxID=568069 RepID=A0A1J1I1V1_9DIPT|nr:CLUMA_CG007703, isoform A [Clunio marinus]